MRVLIIFIQSFNFNYLNTIVYRVLIILTQLYTIVYRVLIILDTNTIVYSYSFNYLYTEYNCIQSFNYLNTIVYRVLIILIQLYTEF